MLITPATVQLLPSQAPQFQSVGVTCQWTYDVAQ
jgi:hypothetical protein